MKTEKEIELGEKLLAAQDEIEKLKKAVSNADRNVSKHLEKIRELEGKDPETPDPAAALEAREKALERREKAHAAAVEQGLDPALVYRMLGIDDSSDDERIAALSSHTEDTLTEARRAFIRANGRTPYNSIKLGGELTAEQLDRLDLTTLAGMDSQILEAAYEKGLGPDDRPTMRQRIAASIARGREE